MRRTPNGFYVPVGDMSALAACIADLAQSRAMLATLGQQAHCTVQNQFSLSQYADRFVALVEDIAHQPLIKTSKDAEQILDCVLPIEEHIMGIHLRRDTVIPQWFQGSKAAAASNEHTM